MQKANSEKKADTVYQLNYQIFPMVKTHYIKDIVMVKNTLIYILVFILCAVVSCLFTCTNDVAGGDSEVETKGGLYGNLVFENGTPAEGATVRIFFVDSVAFGERTNSYITNSTIDSIPVDTVVTDSNGMYLFDSLKAGIYNLECTYVDNGDTLFVYIRGIIFHNIYFVGTNTLCAPGHIKGQVDFEQHNKMGVLIYIPSTSYSAYTDENGTFVFSRVPASSSYSVAYYYPGYLLALDSNVVVRPRDTTDLGIKQLIRDPDSPPPPPVGVKAEYDSVQGIVTVTWNTVNHPYLAGYLVYRKDSSQTAIQPELISGSQLVADTLFFDSIFINIQDTIEKTYQYHVKSQDNNNNQSLFSWPAYVKVFPPDLPRNPFPADGDTGLAPSLTLSWSPVKGNGKDTVTYTVYFDTVTPPLKVYSNNILDTNLYITGMELETVYYWSITACFGSISVTGPIWNFNTCQFGKVKWKFETGGRLFSSGPAVDSNGTVYIGSEDHKLYAINPEGIKKWEFETENKINASPTIGSDGTIYLSSTDGRLYAINTDGILKWKFASNGMISSSAAIGTDGTVYIGSGDGNLYALNNDGSKKWEFGTGQILYASPAIGSDGTIYIGSQDRRLYAINPDGSKKWDFETAGQIMASPAIGGDGKIYISSKNGQLYALNPDGTKMWEFITGGGIQASPVIGLNGTIYIGSDDDCLYAINPDGSKKWEYLTKLSVSSTPSVHFDGTIFIGSQDDRFYAINPDGTKKWEFYIGYNNHLNSSSISPDGTLYFTNCFEYTLYTIIINCGGLADSPWPMFMHDARHTGRSD